MMFKEIIMDEYCHLNVLLDGRKVKKYRGKTMVG
jgi:hypothetical protein